MKSIVSLRALTVSMMVGGIVGLAHADLIFNNGPFNDFYGGNDPFSEGNYVAENFNVTSASTITSITYNAYTVTGDTVTPTQLNAIIYSDNSGAPGAELYSGALTDLVSQTVTNVGVYGDYTLIDYTFAVPDWSLGDGTYWLGLNVLPDQFNMHWSIVNNNQGDGTYNSSYISDSGDPGTYYGYSYQHAFELDGTSGAVPDGYPTAIALLLAMVGLLAANGLTVRSRSVRS